MKNILNKSLLAGAIGAALTMSGAVNADDIVGKVQLNSASVNGVKVKAVNVSTGTTRAVTLNEDGSYRLAKMPSGTYKITVLKNGVVVAEDTAVASLGKNTVTNFDIAAQSDTEVIQVVGSSVATIDVTSSDAGLVVGEVEIDRMPIARNITAVALLAPGVVQGDSQFGNTPSFGGASVAENVCYINGMEVTNTRQGLGCGQLPFEFYKEFQVKTGGYSAKYGRATGGAINATAKSGTNNWEFASVVNYKPNSLRGDGKVSRADGGTGQVFRDTRNDEFDTSDITFSVGGPIIKDKLFFYALVNPRNVSSQVADGGYRYAADDQLYKRDASGSNNIFWGATIDWDISEDHRLSYFGYSDRSDTTLDIYANNLDTGVVGARTGAFLQKRGGETHSVSYTGYWTDDLIITAMAGQIKTEYENTPENLDCPSVYDERTSGAALAVSCGPGGSFGANNDKNTQYAIDAEYTLGDHTITAGYEFQDRSSSRINRPITGHSWTYYTLPAGESIQGDTGTLFTNNSSADADYVSDRIFDGGGGFKSEISAYYIEDKWQVTDNLVLNIGARVDQFKNWGTTDKLLTEFKTDIAPRLGFSWDPTGNGESKFYGTMGQYYLPVANNTIYRAASGVSDTTTHYTFDGVGADGAPTGISPVNGSAGNSQTVGSVATIPEKDIFQAQEADPFSKLEYILGFETMLTDEYSVSVKGTYRTVDTALDDYCGSYAYPYCVLLNPGEDSSWYKDGLYWNGASWDLAPGVTNKWNDPRFDGKPDEGSLTTYSNATQIQLPKAKNEYYALETIVKYNLDDLRWTLSYSWSHSFGNFEGAVKSDIGQPDAGITQDFDFPALMDGADGNQANDRRHVFKFYGSYNITEDWVVGWNSTLASGRPLSAFGKSYPSTDSNLFGGYGDTFYITNEDGSFTRLPRGSVSETPWTFKVDMSTSYDFKVNDIEMQVSMDIFNIFDIQTVTRQDEHFERTAGNHNKYYGSAYEWQAPRSVRLGFEARF